MKRKDVLVVLFQFLLTFSWASLMLGVSILLSLSFPWEIPVLFFCFTVMVFPGMWISQRSFAERVIRWIAGGWNRLIYSLKWKWKFDDIGRWKESRRSAHDVPASSLTDRGFKCNVP